MSINLNEYDITSIKIDKTKTWIDIARKKLISKEIKVRKYNCICKKYNTDTKEYEYFIIMLDTPPTDRRSHKTFVDDYGRIKINLSTIWNESCLANYKKDTNIDLLLVDSEDDGDVYKLNL